MAFASIWGFALVGIEAVPVRVEAHARPGLPGVSIVGLPGAAVREARERIRSGATCSGYSLPAQRITLNLSPGDVPKDGPGFDLPMALATLAACGHLSPSKLTGVGAVGEVSLDGFVRSTRGMLSVAEGARALGLQMLIVPTSALAAAAAVTGVPVIAVRSVGEALTALRDPSFCRRVEERGTRWLNLREGCVTAGGQGSDVDMGEVAGHSHAKRALEVVAAGAHHLLMLGSPGGGKTMLARRLPGILPPLTNDEALEVTKIRGAAGLQEVDGGIARDRPFRAPHHTASRAAVVGGGLGLRPGEVSLAHKGVLFLDELPEFSRDTLEALRQPLEEGRITISRRSGSLVLPAACSLVAAMNPCPCGYLGHPHKECRCAAAAVQRYTAKVSGPLLDRIDVLIEVPPVSPELLDDKRDGESSEVIRARVMAARRFREEHLARQPRKDGTANATPAGWVTAEARRLLREVATKENLSGRGHSRILSLARTIADLDQLELIGAVHVAEALALRLDCRRVGVLP